jgi:exonuclease SbcC
VKVRVFEVGVRDGLQAAEVDAAGPELTELVNDLLRTCVGPRWTVTIETQKLSADGKKLLEGCEVRVLDTVAGREGAAETFSGGERVLLGEAVSLALSMLACRRAGLVGVTLVRDETGAALDPANGRAYVAMLRRAAELVGARQVLFVSHSPELAELADARIVVGGGTAVVG